MSDEIFREVDEEVKQDQWLALWNQYGWYVTGLVIVVLLTTGGITLWQNMEQGRRDERSVAFTAALNIAASGDVPGAIQAFDGLAEDGGGYAMLAQFRQAALAAEQDDVVDALSRYGAIADDDDFDQAYRDMATIMMAATALQAGDAEIDLTAVRQRLSLIGGGENPLRHTAREFSAALALVAGEPEAAVEHLKSLADGADTPLGIRQRAAQLLQAVE